MKNTILVRCYGNIWDKCLTISSGFIRVDMVFMDGIQYGGPLGNPPKSMEVRFAGIIIELNEYSI